MKKTITIYGASSAQLDPVYTDGAYRLGRAIALAGATLVSGGGRTGLMAAAEEGAMSAGGTTVGIVPEFMVERGWQHTGLTHLEIVPDMHTRKATMARMADAVIALPGGVGTFEELMEIITWRQLGLFGGNVVIFNINGYYDPLLTMFGESIRQGFMRPDHRELFTVVTSVEDAVAAALADPLQRTFSNKF